MAEPKNIYERLRATQLELKVPKGQTNTFGRYKYRSAEDILEAVKPVLDKHGLTMMVSDEMVLIGERYYVKATVMVSDGKDDIRVTGWARESYDKKGMDDSQITGTASSYARKYAMNGMFAIDDTKDADTDEHQTEVSQRPPRLIVHPAPIMASETQRATINKWLEDGGIADSEKQRYLTEKFKVKLPLTKDSAGKIIDAIIMEDKA